MFHMRDRALVKPRAGKSTPPEVFPPCTIRAKRRLPTPEFRCTPILSPEPGDEGGGGGGGGGGEEGKGELG